MNDNQIMILKSIQQQASKGGRYDDDEIVGDRVHVGFIKGLSSAKLNLVISSLAEQGYVVIENQNVVGVSHVSLTKAGITKLNIELKNYGKGKFTVHIEIGESMQKFTDELLKSIELSNDVNKEVWIEVAMLIKDELSKDKPRKKAIGMMLSTLNSAIGSTVGLVKIANAVGLDQETVNTFIKTLF